MHRLLRREMSLLAVIGDHNSLVIGTPCFMLCLPLRRAYMR